jgi:transcriptional regulator with XRE-family HTH domain
MRMKVTKGQMLKSRRMRMGLLQRELADRMGCSPSVVCKLEKDGLQDSAKRLEQAHQVLDDIEKTRR